MTIPAPESRWTARAVAEVLAARHEHRPVTPVAIGAGMVDDAVVAALVAHRVVPVVAPHADGLGASRSLAERLHRAHRRSVTTGLSHAADTARISTLLAEAGIRHVVCKGAALDALLGHDPGTRGPSDVDVWVDTGDVADTCRVLTDAGWPRRASMAHYPRPGEGWPWRLLLWGGKELPFDHPTAAPVDLHWRLTNGRNHLSFGFAEAEAHACTLTIAGRSVPTLSLPHTLEHMAAHGRKEAWAYLRQLIDIVELADRLGEAGTHRLAADNAEIAGALGVAAFLAPWLRDVIALDRATERRSAEAWQGCLDLDRRFHTRMALTGAASRRSRLRHEWWTFRSAPTWRTRLGFDTRGALWLAVRAGQWRHRHDRVDPG